jgi:flagellar basal-body rod modification protein FlgD
MAFPIVPVLGAVSSALGALMPRKTETPGRLGKDDFLKLLVAQLKNQNPLSPISNDQLLSQSTQFSTLEELQNIGKTLGTVASASNGASLASGTALLGRPVTATTASFTYAGATVSLPFALESPVSNAALEISDANGTVVATVALGARATGAQTATLQPGFNGRVLPAGQYRYRIMGVDAAGRSTPLPAITGTVTGINLDQGVPVLVLGSRRVQLGDVTTVGNAAN